MQTTITGQKHSNPVDHTTATASGVASASATATTTAIARDHIKVLRKKKFSIGSKRPNPLTQDLHHAVTVLLASLLNFTLKTLIFSWSLSRFFLLTFFFSHKHSCFVSFVACTLIFHNDFNNAEDNQYEDSVEPTLDFALTTQDITGSGAQETLLIFNNEVSFSKQNMESICSVGQSTKKGKRSKGFIGEKGIGFKSVFLVSKLPHIISNGYKVKFSEEPDKECGIGYIVPQWISDEYIVSKIQTVYGSELLPTTTIILPLKPDKVNPVKKELSSLHPELLLILSKLRRLYVHENCSDQKTDSVTAISIVSETNYEVSIIKMQTQELFISQKLRRGTSLVGVFAFLPTSMVINFPFVVQADFILASSRESIVFDNRWNQGILECVPVASVSAFVSCVKQGSPLFGVAEAFKLLPSHASSFQEFNKVRETIRMNLCDALIVPCETFNNQKTFCKPSSAATIDPSFQEILNKMNKSGVSLSGLSSMKMRLVHSSLDQDKYKPSLDFLGIYPQVTWHENCFTACNLVPRASDDMYIDILYFISQYISGSIASFPILKMINEKGEIDWCSIVSKRNVKTKIQYCVLEELHVWLQKCNIQFGCPVFFLPNSTQVALTRHPKGKKVSNWLFYSAGVKTCSAFEYCSMLCDYISHKGESNGVLMLAHFLFHSKQKKFLTDTDISSIARSLPVIDGSGCVRAQRTEMLVTSSGSKWAQLSGPMNPFRRENYIDLSETYAANGVFAAENTPDKMLLRFLTLNAAARDPPEISLPNLPLPAASSLMTREQAFLLLGWIRFHRTRVEKWPVKFIESIRSGKWMKTKTGVDCPSSCTIPTESGKAVLELMKDVLSGFSIVEENFYGDQIRLYIDELTFLGVQCGINGVQKIIMDRFKVLSSTTMKREEAFSLLLFIGFLKERKMLDEQWINTMTL
ncbi:uncharacterized protein LOC110719948 [Chenopodium quinoa]|uniref:uncharacterized protein LOC110719948 n=1 Tax=Chenopodium quinoa TaxID=63459 RepID=UPI000B7711F0|nr:uncharacterized protein LOC110719948 [Chenopodium quinoa]